MDYENLIKHLKNIKSRITDAEEVKAVTEVIDIVADYEKAADQTSELIFRYETPDMAIRRQAGIYVCPLCGKRTQVGHTHCHWCGKKLTWDREAFASRDYPHLSTRKRRKNENPNRHTERIRGRL